MMSEIQLNNFLKLPFLLLMIFNVYLTGKQKKNKDKESQNHKLK